MCECTHNEQDKLYRSLRRFRDDAAARDIACGVPLPADASDEEKAAWVRHVCAALDRDFDTDAIQTIRTACHCTEEGRMGEMKTWLGRLYAGSGSIGEFVDKVNAEGAGWHMEGRTIHTIFRTCECHMVQGVDRLPTMTWCHCTLGYTRALFEHVFGCEVEAELLQTIKTGSPFCIVAITPKADPAK